MKLLFTDEPARNHDGLALPVMSCRGRIGISSFRQSWRNLNFLPARFHRKPTIRPSSEHAARFAPAAPSLHHLAKSRE